MSGDMIEVVSDLAGLRALGEEWNTLAARFASPFLRHEWNLACAEAFGDSLRPAVHVLRSGGRIAAIAPLALVHGDADGRRRRGVRWLELLGRPAGDAVGFLYRDEASLEELLKRLLACRRPIGLFRVETDGIEARLLRKLRAWSSFSITRDAGACLWLSVGTGWGEVEARISPSHRKTIRRRRRQAEKLGEVRFETIIADEATVDQHLEEFYRVEAAGWKARSGTAIMMQPDQERFLTLYGQMAARAGVLRFYFLRINGKAAAAQMMVECGDRLWALKMGYDERWREVSPGILLIHEILRHACEQGSYEAVEFQGEAEAYKAIWTDRRRHYSSIRVYPVLFPLGGLALGQDLAAFARRRAGRVVGRVYPWGVGRRAGHLADPAAGAVP